MPPPPFTLSPLSDKNKLETEARKRWVRDHVQIALLFQYYCCHLPHVLHITVDATRREKCELILRPPGIQVTWTLI